MKRGEPLRRSGGLRRGRGLVRSTRLHPVSERRASEQEARDTLREAVSAAFGHRCALGGRGDCRNEYGAVWRAGDRLDVHEVIRRSQLPGAHLVPAVCLPLCRGHHNLDVSLPAGESAGIRAPGWTVDRYGVERVVAELARVRAGWCARQPVVPFWRADEPVWSAET